MFHKAISINYNDQEFVLDQSKTVYWKNQNALLVSDVHAGKATHFRKNGIPLSSDHLLNDLNTVERLLDQYQPKTIYFLGDLFHSKHNIEVDLIQNWVKGLSQEVVLILGNHDVHSETSHSIPTRKELEIDAILLSHEPIEEYKGLNICGHLHPGISLYGGARQTITMPCYYYSNRHLILPSFGSLTGKRQYKELINNSRLYPITDEGIFELSLT
jgi:DNA ligase-associated metallophosphoesterase